jgi:uncharacterized protein YjbI with pentapeptide repeats
MIAMACMVIIPKWQTRKVTEPDKRLELENKLRATLAQILGGAVLLGGLYFTWQSLEESRKTLDVSREGQITERFTRAIDQLGSDKLEVRLGGIYGLERIANDSAKDHWQVMEVLTTYVRERLPWDNLKEHRAKGLGVSKTEASAHLKTEDEQEEIEPPPSDVQAVLTVLGRRGRFSEEKENQRLNLTSVDLRRANLRDAHLEKADLREAHLEGAFLTEAHLEGANLYRTHLEGAFLAGAQLQKAKLIKTYLISATLESARLKEASLHGAYLMLANLSRASLEDADLTRSSMEGAYLKDANLRGAVLRAVDLREAFLGGADLQEADLTEVRNLTLKQISVVKTLYNATLEETLMSQISNKYPDLLKAP